MNPPIVFAWFTPSIVEHWLESDMETPRPHFPDVAGAVVQWLVNGRRQEISELATSLWTDFPSGQNTEVLSTSS